MHEPTSYRASLVIGRQIEVDERILRVDYLFLLKNYQYSQFSPYFFAIQTNEETLYIKEVNIDISYRIYK